MMALQKLRGAKIECVADDALDANVVTNANAQNNKSAPINKNANGTENQLRRTPNAKFLDLIDLQWFAKPEDEGRTEEASEHKIRKEREKGRVAKSQDFNGALVLLLPAITLVLCAPWIVKECASVIQFYFTRCTDYAGYEKILLGKFAISFVKIVSPIALTAIVAGVASNIFQNKGFLFSTEPIKPKFSKILPKFGDYFKNTLFSTAGAFNVVKSILKVAIIVIIAYMLIKGDLDDGNMQRLMNVSFAQGIKHIGVMAAKLLLVAAAVFIICAIPDMIMQKKQFLEKLKMTKQEVKEEYKELEGDPLVKNMLRQRMRDMMSKNIPKLVSEADVIITNPTHFACAIAYDRERMPGPMLTVKGADSLAQRIKQIARDYEVPIIENKPLARALYAEVEVGDVIPETYYQALATILAKVYTMNPSKKSSKYIYKNE